MKTHPTLARAIDIVSTVRSIPGANAWQSPERRSSSAATPRGVLTYMRKEGLRFPRKAPCGKLPDPKLHGLLDRAPVGTPVQLAKPTLTSYRWKPLYCADSCAAALSAVQKDNPRKKNLYAGSPHTYGPAIRERVAAIEYKGRFKRYKGSEIYADYQSAAGVSRSGKSCVVVTGCILVRRLRAPAGMIFDLDDNGILLRRLSDGMDFHPDKTTLMAKNWIGLTRAAMAKNYSARQAQKRAEKQAENDKAAAAKRQAQYLADSATTRVSIVDARRAGNCLEGCVAFAVRKLRVSREQLHVDGNRLGPAAHLVTFRADFLRSVANGDGPRVEAAIRAAYERETAISI